MRPLGRPGGAGHSRKTGEVPVSVACRGGLVHSGRGSIVESSPIPYLMARPWRGIRSREHVLFRRAAAIDLRARPRPSRPYARSPRHGGTPFRRSGRTLRELLSERGEASGVALAREILTRYGELTTGPRIAFFEALGQNFGPDHARLSAATAAWQQIPRTRPPSSAPGLGAAPAGTVPPAQSGARRNRRTGAHARAAARGHGPPRRSRRRRCRLCPPVLVLVQSRLPGAAQHRLVDAPRSCSRRSSATRRCTPSAAGTICAAASDAPDRRCYAFFHPALIDEPLIFVEVALTREIPAAIAPILAEERDIIEPDKAVTAVFYSISNCQRGLTGVSFGHF